MTGGTRGWIQPWNMDVELSRTESTLLMQGHKQLLAIFGGPKIAIVGFMPLPNTTSHLIPVDIARSDVIPKRLQIVNGLTPLLLPFHCWTPFIRGLKSYWHHASTCYVIASWYHPLCCRHYCGMWACFYHTHFQAVVVLHTLNSAVFSWEHITKMKNLEVKIID